MRTLAAFVFPGFETLDYFGPIEMLGSLQDDIELITVAQHCTPVPSAQGQRIVVDKTIAEKDDYDLLLIPGGDSALREGEDPELLEWLQKACANAEYVMSVCTGSILLGMAGVLDGHKATTNKLDFTNTVHLAPKVDWIKQARWVEDGKFFTSSGVSAGIDMSLAVIEKLYGQTVAQDMAISSEYEWHRDANRDPFAKLAGLI